MRRRDLIKATGVTAFAGLTAGCIGGEGPGGGEASPTDTSEPTDTPEPTDTSEPTETDAGTETAGGESDITGTVGDTEDNLEVTNHEVYQTGGEVGLRGTIENTGNNAYGYVEAEVTLQDDQGEILYEFIDETEEESVPKLEAGSTWQFDVVFEEAQMAEVASYTIDVDGYPVPDEDFGNITGELDNQDENVKILTTHLTRQESQTFVTGAVKNVGGEAAENVEVNVTLYDDNNNELFDFNDTVEEEEERQQLAPGEIWNFRVQFEDIDMSKVARYVVTAESELV